MLDEIEKMDVGTEYRAYKRVLDFRTDGYKLIESVPKDCTCYHCKSPISSGEEGLVIRPRKRVFCKTCVINSLKMKKAAIMMENLPFDDVMEEIRVTNLLIELVKLYLNPVKRGAINEEETTENIISFKPINNSDFTNKTRNSKSRYI